MNIKELEQVIAQQRADNDRWIRTVDVYLSDDFDGNPPSVAMIRFAAREVADKQVATAELTGKILQELNKQVNTANEMSNELGTAIDRFRDVVESEGYEPDDWWDE